MNVGGSALACACVGDVLEPVHTLDLPEGPEANLATSVLFRDQD